MTDTLSASIAMGFMDPINPVTIPQHIALLAADEFYTKRDSRFPGSSVAFTRSITGASLGDLKEVEEDVVKMKRESADEADMISDSAEVCDRLGVKDDEEREMVFDACKEL